MTYLRSTNLLLVFILYIVLINSGSAIAADTNVVGGVISQEYSRPWVVALVFKNDLNNRSAQFCGGTIIGSREILTAAHCIHKVSKNNMQVLSGTQYLSTGGSRQNVVEIIEHPGYNPKNHDNDLAILKLDRRPIGNVITIEKTVVDSAFMQKNSEAIVAGWGYTEDDNNKLPIALHEVKVPITPKVECKSAYQKLKAEVTDNMLCAGNKNGGKDSCQGDSGGPLLYTATNNSLSFLQIGIVSWGIGCAEPNQYGVYTRVSNYVNWINEHIGECIPTANEC